MRYLLMALENPEDFEARDDPARTEEYWASWNRYIEALAESGVLESGVGLQPPTMSTTVRVRGGSRLVEDGPFADSKEHLGGYFVIDVEDIDAALAWAERCPSATYASVEVRPLLPMRD